MKNETKNEPDKYAMDIECTKCGAKQSGVLTVHTTSPQRKPLTDEELLRLLSKIDEWAVRLPRGLREFARAIEQAHGIKGEA